LEIASEYRLANSSVTSVSGNQLTITTSGNDYLYFQPGLKIGWVYLYYNWVEVTTILSVATRGPNYILTVSTSNFAPSAAGYLFVLPREDVLVWTLGYDTPVVQFEDADACFLENVTLSGGTSDIEERYIRMARPMWQTAGDPVGIPNSQYVQRPTQYNHLLLTPASKVSTAKIDNVRSYTKYKNTATMKGRR
jgi:hypothetical protein